jgi:hypothetical protein
MIDKKAARKDKLKYNIHDAFVFLERVEDSEAKKELRNILHRIDDYSEEI